MNAANSKNKWFIVLFTLVIIATGLWVLDHYTEKRASVKLINECRNKVWYDIPLLQFKNYGPGVKTTVLIKRNGKLMSAVLSLKELTFQNAAVYELTANDSNKPVVNKQDSIFITIGNRKHMICGFDSQSYYGDHHIVFCDELYQMDGKTFRSKDLNWVYKKK